MPYFVRCSRDTLPRPLLRMPEGVSAPRPAPRESGGPFLYNFVIKRDWQTRDLDVNSTWDNVKGEKP